VNANDGVIGVYKHGDRIAVLSVLEGGDEDLAKDIAMHIAASKPECEVRIKSIAASISPLVSLNAFLQSIMPAPVLSLNSLTINAVIAITIS
jgi:hypothetical protein